jgi:uridine kinase
MSKIKKVIKRSGALVDFSLNRIANAIYRAAVSVGGRDRDMAQHLAQLVVQTLEETLPPGKIPHVEEIQDAVEKVLIENGHAAVAKAFILYRDERKRSRETSKTLALHSSSNIPWKKIWYVLDWAVEHKVNTINSLNERIAKGEFANIVAETEEVYNQDVENAVDLIAERSEGLRMVIITGPSSSGKTTTTIKVSDHLGKLGMKLTTLNVDNYFFNLEAHPQDEFGDFDFETPQALDLPLINEHLHKMLAGEEVMIPFYDFKTGTRQEAQTPMQVAKDEVILIDSLHGLFPDMTEGISEEQQFKLYLEPLLQMKDEHGKYIRWTDLRLIRRMLRDEVHRNWEAQHTLTHWHYVRTSEMRNIIPYIPTTDYIINTGMPYELSIYRPRMLDKFAQWAKEYKNEPLRLDAYHRASRVHKILQQVTSIEDDSPIPGDSVLREFIGGSIYDQH